MVPGPGVFLKLFGMNEATLMRGPPDGGKRSARTDLSFAVFSRQSF